MARRRRKSQRPDLEAIQAGTIPWSDAELTAAVLEHHRLCTTPHDDWDRRPQGFILVEDDGTQTGYRFNPDMIGNQINMFIRDRCREVGYDQTTTMSHMWRFMEVQYFVGENIDRLTADDLIRPDRDDPKEAHMSGHLFAVLAVAAYNGTKVHPVSGDKEKTFDYDEIVAKVKAMGPED